MGLKQSRTTKRGLRLRALRGVRLRTGGPRYSDRGATVVELGLVIGLVVVGAMGALESATELTGDAMQSSVSEVGQPADLTTTTAPGAGGGGGGSGGGGSGTTTTAAPTTTTVAPATTTTAPTTTSTMVPTTTTRPTTTTTSPDTRVADQSCEGRWCRVELHVAAGRTVTWSLDGQTVATGPVISGTIDENGTYELRAIVRPGDEVFEFEIKCTGKGAGAKCKFQDD